MLLREAHGRCAVRLRWLTAHTALGTAKHAISVVPYPLERPMAYHRSSDRRCTSRQPWSRVYVHIRERIYNALHMHGTRVSRVLACTQTDGVPLGQGAWSV